MERLFNRIIKRNRASSLSVLVAAFISALFLSLLCDLFYNFWNYEIESIVLEEGNCKPVLQEHLKKMRCLTLKL